MRSMLSKCKKNLTKFNNSIEFIQKEGKQRISLELKLRNIESKLNSEENKLYM